MSKLLVIDKSTFVGTNLNMLCDFAAGHFLILPMTLYGECATNDEKRRSLFDRFQRIITSGGYTCNGTDYIIESERLSLQPFDFHADVDKETSEMRKIFESGGEFAKSVNIDEIYYSHTESVQTFVNYHKIVTDYVDNITKGKVNAAFEEVKKLNTDIKGRFVIWAKTVNNLDIHDLVVKCKFSNSPNEYCLSNEWVTWHWLRIAAILALEYTFLQGKTGENQLKIVEHDLYDAQYILFLSKCDGLLVRDDGCASLAKAAFPEKDIFSSIDEVTEDYRC